VLLVFGLLVIPSVAGLMATSRPGPALAVGWSFGFLGSLLGLVGSVRFDLPAAPSILVALASLLVAFGIVLSVAARRRAPLSAGESF
jgi:ABC-type Mn2+/Zn2+ transport system permease subunit